MAMNGNILGTLMKTNVDAYIAGLSNNEKQNITDAIREDIFQEMGKAVVSHIKAAGIVSTIVTGTLPNGPVAASGTGSIS